MKKLTVAFIAALAPFFCVGRDADSDDVDIKASDGINLKGTYFSPGRRCCSSISAAWTGMRGTASARISPTPLPRSGNRLSRVWRERRRAFDGHGAAASGHAAEMARRR
jgi:hypothetical protein